MGTETGHDYATVAYDAARGEEICGGAARYDGPAFVARTMPGR